MFLLNFVISCATLTLKLCHIGIIFSNYLKCHAIPGRHQVHTLNVSQLVLRSRQESSLHVLIHPSCLGRFN